jgi:hypothetical protein
LCSGGPGPKKHNGRSLNRKKGTCVESFGFILQCCSRTVIAPALSLLAQVMIALCRPALSLLAQVSHDCSLQAASFGSWLSKVEKERCTCFIFMIYFLRNPSCHFLLCKLWSLLPAIVCHIFYIYLSIFYYPIRIFPFNLYIHRPCRAVFCDAAAAGQSVDWWRNTSPPRRSTIWLQVKKTQRFCGKGLDISGVYDGNTPSSQLTSPFPRGKASVNGQSISIATYVSLRPKGIYLYLGG